MNSENIWNSFLDKIKDDISSMSFDTWFKDNYIKDIVDNKIIMIVPSNIHKKHLKQNYGDIIDDTFNQITGSNFEIEFVVEDEIKDMKQDIAEDAGVPFISSEQANLKSDFTFSSFVVGDSNRFAHAAALSVAENPGKIYNPLFLYGKSGLGKTHLMHAIGNHILENSNKKVLYVTSEQFITDFLGLSKKDHKGQNFDYMEYFKNKYRNVDVLIIDDIQFLANATATQHEFFHTYNELYNSNKQIIISSDRSPEDLKLLEDRLTTRFSSGLTVNVYPPEFNLRVEILKNKIKGQNLLIEIPNIVIEYIANNCQSDVRQLEGAVTRLYAYVTIMNYKEITLEIAIEALKDYLNKSVSFKNNIQKIQRIVADYYNISVDDLKSKRRMVTIAFPRQIAMYLCRKYTDESFPKIGLEFGGKDHSTVIHAVDKIEGETKINNQLREVLEKLKNDIM